LHLRVVIVKASTFIKKYFYMHIVFRRCAPIALTGHTSQILALGEKHNVLSETQQFGSSCTYINRPGGTRSNLKTPAGVGSAMRRYFQEDVGGRRRGSSAALSATAKAPEAEYFDEFTTGLGG
jgi:hypothetical protein